MTKSLHGCSPITPNVLFSSAGWNNLLYPDFIFHNIATQMTALVTKNNTGILVEFYGANSSALKEAFKLSDF